MKAKISPRINLENRTKLEEVIPLSTPFIIFVDPSSECNSKCKFCPTGDRELIKNTGRWQGQMNIDLYKRIIDNIGEFDKSLKVLRLYKDGEPLLNNKLYKMIECAKNTGYINYVDTTTNGFLINNEKMKPIIDAGLDKINISVNGLSDEQFLKFTGNRINFDKYVNNIKNLYEIKEDCEILIKINGDYLSEKEKTFFYKTFGNYCDKIFIENVTPCWSGFDVESRSNIKISNKKGIYNQPINKEIQICPYIFYSMSINSDGKVSLCFLDWARKLIIGDIKKEKLKDIWNGTILFNHRINNLSGDRKKNVICGKCGQLTHCMPDNIDSYKNELKTKMIKKYNREVH